MSSGQNSEAPAETPDRNLRLIALDAEDLAVLAAHLQDSILRVGDMLYQPGTRRFILALNRFDWLAAAGGAPQRAQAGLHFDRVSKVALQGFRQDRPDDILNLLDIEFHARRRAGRRGEAGLFRRLRAAAGGRMP